MLGMYASHLPGQNAVQCDYPDVIVAPLEADIGADRRSLHPKNRVNCACLVAHLGRVNREAATERDAVGAHSGDVVVRDELPPVEHNRFVLLEGAGGERGELLGWGEGRPQSADVGTRLRRCHSDAPGGIG